MEIVDNSVDYGINPLDNVSPPFRAIFVGFCKIDGFCIVFDTKTITFQSVRIYCVFAAYIFAKVGEILKLTDYIGKCVLNKNTGCIKGEIINKCRAACSMWGDFCNFRLYLDAFLIYLKKDL